MSGPSVASGLGLVANSSTRRVASGLGLAVTAALETMHRIAETSQLLMRTQGGYVMHIPSRLRLSALASVAAVAVAACAEGGPSLADEDASPGGGTAPAAPRAIETWQFDTLPLIVLEAGENALAGEPAGMTWAAASGFLVADLAGSRIRVFDAGGRYLRSIGSRGQGPGEFPSFLLGVRPLSDGRVIGIERRSMTEFSADGQPLRRINLAADSLRSFFGDEETLAGVTVLGGAGGLILQLRQQVAEANGDLRMQADSDRLVWVDEQRRIVAQLGPFAGVVTLILSGASGNTQYRSPVPGLREVLVAADPAGRLVCAATPTAPDFECHKSSQEVLRAHSGIPSEELSDEQIQSWRDRVSQQVARSGTPAARVGATVSQWPKSRSAPLIDRIVVGSDLRIWLRRNRQSGDSSNARDWVVLDSVGSVIAHAVLPSSFNVEEIRGDTLLGWHQTPTGEIVLSVHTVRHSSQMGYQVSTVLAYLVAARVFRASHVPGEASVSRLPQ